MFVLAPKDVALEGSDANQVVNNDIWAGWQGVLLSSGSKGNKIIANHISGPQAAGIALEAGVTNNKVHANRVACARGYQCLTVDASPRCGGTTRSPATGLYVPFECPGQGFTLKMTRRGHVSVYGCCGI